MLLQNLQWVNLRHLLVILVCSCILDRPPAGNTAGSDGHLPSAVYSLDLRQIMMGPACRWHLFATTALMLQPLSSSLSLDHSRQLITCCKQTPAAAQYAVCR